MTQIAECFVVCGEMEKALALLELDCREGDKTLPVPLPYPGVDERPSGSPIRRPASSPEATDDVGSTAPCIL